MSDPMTTTDPKLIEPVALQVWRDAVYAYGGMSIEGCEGEHAAAAVIAAAINEAAQAIRAASYD